MSEPGRAAPPAPMRVFYDGTLSDPQLDHPEGIGVHRDGSLWCGGERGQIFRIEPDGSAIEQVASTGGFCLGLAFGPDDALYVCDLKNRAVFRLAEGSDRPERFAEGFRLPNYPCFDVEGRLYVSDSHGFKERGPGIWRFEPDGSGGLWYDEPLDFANGLALAPDGRSLYVAETFGNRILRVGLDGGASEVVVTLAGVLPDGLAFDVEGNLYVACYEPSQVLRLTPGGVVETVAFDPEAHALCHPTNIAFRGTTLFASNLGRWHVTAIEVGVEGLPLRGAGR
jgi:gluconolactonase